MSKIDYQALLRAAVKIGAEKWTHDGNGEVTTEEYVADGQTLVDHVCNCEVIGTSSLIGEFIALANPAAILALLDERERNQQYIKSRDQENEEIALTVGKLRVELEGKDRRITEVTMWIKRLSSSLKNAKPDSKLPDDAMIWLNNEGLTSIEDILR